SPPRCTDSPRPTLFPYTTLFRSMSSGAHPHAAARRAALDILFQADLRSESPGDALADWASDEREIPAFTRELVEGVAAHLQDLRSEEHTSELQSRENLVCRLLLE